MRKTVFILSVIVSLAMVGFGFTIEQGGDQYAEIKFDKTVHDYGKITKGSDGKCTFTYTNNGTDMLFITRVAKSCGCTTPVYSKEPLMPGQSAKIEVGYDTNLLGVFNKKITVFSNAVNNSVILTIKGEVVE
jgi:hypothetical protein